MGDGPGGAQEHADTGRSHGPGRWPGARSGWPPTDEHTEQALMVPWSTGDGFLLVAWSVVAQILVGIPFAAAGITLTTGINALVAVLASQVVTLAGIVLWLGFKDTLSWRLLGQVRPAWSHLAVGVGVGIGGFAMVAAVQIISRLVFDQLEAPSQRVLELTTQGDLALVLGGISAIALAPIVEELIFRGVLFQGLRDRVGLAAAIGVSSAVFGAVHLNLYLATDGGFNPDGLPAVAALTLLGAWFAGVLHRTGSIVVAVVGHATFNAVAIALAILSTRIP